MQCTNWSLRCTWTGCCRWSVCSATHSLLDFSAFQRHWDRVPDHELRYTPHDRSSPSEMAGYTADMVSYESILKTNSKPYDCHHRSFSFRDLLLRSSLHRLKGTPLISHVDWPMLRRVKHSLAEQRPSCFGGGIVRNENPRRLSIPLNFSTDVVGSIFFCLTSLSMNEQRDAQTSATGSVKSFTSAVWPRIWR